MGVTTAPSIVVRTVQADANVYQKWPEEKQEKIPERQSRRPSPDLREPGFSSPLEGSTVTSRVAVSPPDVWAPPPPSTARLSWSTSPPRTSSPRHLCVDIRRISGWCIINLIRRYFNSIL